MRPGTTRGTSIAQVVLPEGQSQTSKDRPHLPLGDPRLEENFSQWLVLAAQSGGSRGRGPSGGNCMYVLQLALLQGGLELVIKLDIWYRKGYWLPYSIGTYVLCLCLSSQYFQCASIVLTSLWCLMYRRVLRASRSHQTP